MTKKLFLTSCVSNVAKDISSRIPDLTTKNKLVFIDTPVEFIESYKKWAIEDRKAIVEAGFNVTDYTITGKTREMLEKDLAKYDYIYVSGGHTLYLLKKAQESGFIQYIQKTIQTGKKTYISTSAGSIIAGPYIHDYLLDEDDIRDVGGIENSNAFNLVNFLIVPHWGHEQFKDLYLKERLKLSYRDNQLPLFLLTDNQYVEVIDDKIIIHDVKNNF